MLKITIKDDLYPQSLLKIKNPPKELYLDGNINLLKIPSIAIIGSSNSTENGIQITQKFATELSMSGITVVSGLAKGIDTTAHSFSYMNIGKTIAVLGSGLERVYPSENKPLYKRIIKNGGLILSEYPPRERFKKDYFIARNRIISGLSLGVIVIEATYRSGTSTTARNAMEQGKPVFSVPHEIWDSHGVGTNRLLKKGAHIITSSQDILDYLKLNDYKKNYLELKEKGIFDNLLHISPTHKKLLTNISSKTIQKKSIDIKDEKAKKVYEIISNESSAISISELTQQTSFTSREILSITFMLEIDGYIKKVEGGYICI